MAVSLFPFGTGFRMTNGHNTAYGVIPETGEFVAVAQLSLSGTGSSARMVIKLDWFEELKEQMRVR